jgi:hypothetical protein
MTPRHALLALLAVASREVGKFVRQGGRLAFHLSPAPMRPRHALLALNVFASREVGKFDRQGGRLAFHQSPAR